MHGGGDFGIGIESTSHIKSRWGQIKSKIKEIYHIIPPKQFILFVKECEYKIIFKNLSYENKISQFFDCFENNKNFDNNDLKFNDNKFLDYEDNDGYISDDDEEE